MQHQCRNDDTGTENHTDIIGQIEFALSRPSPQYSFLHQILIEYGFGVRKIWNFGDERKKNPEHIDPTNSTHQRRQSPRINPSGHKSCTMCGGCFCHCANQTPQTYIVMIMLQQAAQSLFARVLVSSNAAIQILSSSSVYMLRFLNMKSCFKIHLLFYFQWYVEYSVPEVPPVLRLLCFRYPGLSSHAQTTTIKI